MLQSVPNAGQGSAINGRNCARKGVLHLWISLCTKSWKAAADGLGAGVKRAVHGSEKYRLNDY
jgi:hypothetical protein